MSPSRVSSTEYEPESKVDHRCQPDYRTERTSMDEAMSEDVELLSEAIVVWVGWGTSPWPLRDESRVVELLGEELASLLMPAVLRAEREFYQSDARNVVAGLAQMGEVAAEQFRRSRPDLSDEAVRALAWCYTYDFK